MQVHEGVIGHTINSTPKLNKCAIQMHINIDIHVHADDLKSTSRKQKAHQIGSEYNATHFHSTTGVHQGNIIAHDVH